MALAVHDATSDRLSFDVTRCRDAEVYRALGLTAENLKIGRELAASTSPVLIADSPYDVGLSPT